ncbi:MAG: Ig-like domain-containing protein [Bacteroidales bacterium]
MINVQLLIRKPVFLPSGDIDHYEPVVLDLHDKYSLDIQSFGRNISALGDVAVSRSLQIVLLNNANNRRALDFIEEPVYYSQRNSWEPWEADVLIDGSAAYSGYLYYEDSTESGINVRFVEYLNSVFNFLSTKYLRDLDWSVNPDDLSDWLDAAPLDPLDPPRGDDSWLPKENWSDTYSLQHHILEHIMNKEQLSKHWTIGDGSLRNIYGQDISSIFCYIMTYRGKYDDWFNANIKVGTKAVRDAAGVLDADATKNNIDTQEVQVRTDYAAFAIAEDGGYHFDADENTEDQRIDFADDGAIKQYFGEYRSYVQRPAVRLRFVLERIKKLLADNGYRLNLADELFFTDGNPFFHNLYMALPFPSFSPRTFVEEGSDEDVIPDLNLPDLTDNKWLQRWKITNFWDPTYLESKTKSYNRTLRDSTATLPTSLVFKKSQTVLSFTAPYDLDLQVEFIFTVRYKAGGLYTTKNWKPDKQKKMVNGIWLGVEMLINGAYDAARQTVVNPIRKKPYMFICDSAVTANSDDDDTFWYRHATFAHRDPPVYNEAVVGDYPVEGRTHSGDRYFRGDYAVYASKWTIGDGMANEQPWSVFNLYTGDGDNPENVGDTNEIPFRGVYSVKKGEQVVINMIAQGWGGVFGHVESANDGYITSPVDIGFAQIPTAKVFKSAAFGTDRILAPDRFLQNEEMVTLKDILVDYAKLFGLYYRSLHGAQTVELLLRGNYYKNGIDLDITPLEINRGDTKTSAIIPEFRYGLLGQKESGSDTEEEYKKQKGLNYGDVKIDINNTYSAESKDLVRTSVFSEVIQVQKYKAAYAIAGLKGLDFRFLFDCENDNTPLEDQRYFVFFLLGGAKDGKRIKMEWTPLDKPVLISDDPPIQFDGLGAWTDLPDRVVQQASAIAGARFISNKEGVPYVLDFAISDVIYGQSDLSNARTFFDLFWKDYEADALSGTNRYLDITIRDNNLTEKDLMENFLMYRNQRYVVDTLTYNAYDRNYALSLRRILKKENYTALPDIQDFIPDGYIKIRVNLVPLLYSDYPSMPYAEDCNINIFKPSNVMIGPMRNGTYYMPVFAYTNILVSLKPASAVTANGFGMQGVTCNFLLIVNGTPQKLSVSGAIGADNAWKGMITFPAGLVAGDTVEIVSACALVATGSGNNRQEGYIFEPSIAPQSFSSAENFNLFQSHLSNIVGYAFPYAFTASTRINLLTGASEALENSVGMVARNGLVISADRTKYSSAFGDAGTWLTLGGLPVTSFIYGEFKDTILVNTASAIGMIANGRVVDAGISVAANGGRAVVNGTTIALYDTLGKSWGGNSFGSLASIPFTFTPFGSLYSNDPIDNQIIARLYVYGYSPAAERVGLLDVVTNKFIPLFKPSFQPGTVYASPYAAYKATVFSAPPNLEILYPDGQDKYIEGQAIAVRLVSGELPGALRLTVDYLDGTTQSYPADVRPTQDDSIFLLFFEHFTLRNTSVEDFSYTLSSDNGSWAVKISALCYNLTRPASTSFSNNGRIIGFGAYLNIWNGKSIDIGLRLRGKALFPTHYDEDGTQIDPVNSDIDIIPHVTDAGVGVVSWTTSMPASFARSHTKWDDSLGYVIITPCTGYSLILASNDLKYLINHADSATTGDFYTHRFLHSFIASQYAFAPTQNTQPVIYNIEQNQLLPFELQDFQMTWLKSDEKPFDPSGQTVFVYFDDGSLMLTILGGGWATLKAPAGKNLLENGNFGIAEYGYVKADYTCAQVRLSVQTLQLNVHEISLVRGQTYRLVAKVLPELGDTQTVLWEISDTAFATLTPSADTLECDVTIAANLPSGKVQAVVKATIRDATSITAISDSCTVTLTQLAIAVVPAYQTIQWGGTGAVTAVLTPAISPTPALTWSVVSGPGSVSGSGTSATISMPNGATVPTVVRCALTADSTVFGEATASPRP